jgi:hypothetical protein
MHSITRVAVLRSFTKHFRSVAADTSPSGMEEVIRSVQSIIYNIDPFLPVVNCHFET